jgi:hypothetical protein
MEVRREQVWTTMPTDTQTAYQCVNTPSIVLSSCEAIGPLLCTRDGSSTVLRAFMVRQSGADSALRQGRLYSMVRQTPESTPSTRS